MKKISNLCQGEHQYLKLPIMNYRSLLVQIFVKGGKSMSRYTGPAFKKSRRYGFSTLETGKELRAAITEYAENVAKEVTGKDNTHIYMSSAYNDVPYSDLSEKSEQITFLGDIDCDEIYMDLYGGWVYKDEFTSKQKLFILK